MGVHIGTNTDEFGMAWSGPLFVADCSGGIYSCTDIPRKYEIRKFGGFPSCIFAGKEEWEKACRSSAPQVCMQISMQLSMQLDMHLSLCLSMYCKDDLKHGSKHGFNHVCLHVIGRHQ